MFQCTAFVYQFLSSVITLKHSEFSILLLVSLHTISSCLHCLNQALIEIRSTIRPSLCWRDVFFYYSHILKRSTCMAILQTLHNLKSKIIEINENFLDIPIHRLSRYTNTSNDSIKYIGILRSELIELLKSKFCHKNILIEWLCL